MFVVGRANLPSGIVGAISGAIPYITAGVVAAALPSEVLTRSKLIGITIGFADVLRVAPSVSAEPAWKAHPHCLASVPHSPGRLVMHLHWFMRNALQRRLVCDQDLSLANTSRGCPFPAE